MVGYTEAQIAAGRLKGHATRSWRRGEAPQRGMSGQALVDWAYAMAAKYPDNVRLN